MEDCIKESLVEFLEGVGIRLTPKQLNEISKDLCHGVEMYQEMQSQSIPYWNPAEDKVRELSKQMESMHEDRVVKGFETKLDDHKREIKRLHLVIEDLQTRLRNA